MIHSDKCLGNDTQRGGIVGRLFLRDISVNSVNY